MLIGICGAKCAGKSAVAQYLIDHHGFTKLYLEQKKESQTGVPEQPSNSEAIPTTLSIHQPSATPASHTFPTATALLDFVTKSWRSRWVTTEIHTEAVLDALSRRPFFILISVDAPLTLRWRRHQQRSSSLSSPSSTTTAASPPISLEDFVTQSDTHLYSPYTGAQSLISRATIRLLNTSSSLAHLYATLGKLDLTNPDRLRPSWDSYFMSLASLAAQRSNCMKRAVGCVLVGRERRVISTGYNGTPRNLVNCGEGGCARCNSGEGSGVSLGTCLCLHAEENALLEAGRERIREGSVLYCNTCPCLTCSIKIVQVGISEVVYSQGYSMDGETAEVFKTAGIRLRQFSPPANGLIHLERLE
ncbi:cytidine deaminase-like protein [Pseudomassariella vexata]|uniref:Deoxycytidylate deaminase n=1 Tax=Pseudomassariella vexata TaxID=1141098 RepID=A0A1Y2E0A7_9PEZI|nr:cytidine deaminase-like protein [Pseudomassariella vexata]ORY64968.1 cytidine deaminase-like protein [Pseudomassariella vexata]